MTDNVELDPKKLTFSQNRGYKPIPSPLALEEINRVALIKLVQMGQLVWKSPNVWIDIQWLHSATVVHRLR